MTQIIRARIIYFLNHRCMNYQVREIIRGRELLFYFIHNVRELFKCANYLKHNAQIIQNYFKIKLIFHRCMNYLNYRAKNVKNVYPNDSNNSYTLWFQIIRAPNGFKQFAREIIRGRELLNNSSSRCANYSNLGGAQNYSSSAYYSSHQGIVRVRATKTSQICSDFPSSFCFVVNGLIWS